MGSLIGQRIDYSGVGVLRGQWDIPSKKWPKQTFPPPPLPRTYKQEGQFMLCKYLKNLPWSWETIRKPCLAKTLPNSSYLEQCSPTPWLTNINALTKAKKNNHYKSSHFPKETSVANRSQVLVTHVWHFDPDTCVMFWLMSTWCNDRKREVFAMQNQHRYCVYYTQNAHSICGRPTLKDVECFQKGSVCEPY